MGRRGPHSEPAAIKKAKGNSGRRKIGEDPAPSAVAVVSVKPPSWLKGRAKRVWSSIAPDIIGKKLLTQTDAATFARYCVNFARWLDANDYINNQGAHYSTDTGYDRVRSAMVISLRLDPILERVEDRFGLNPAERQRIFAARAAQPAGAGDLFPSGTSAPKGKPAEDDTSPLGYLQ